MLTMKVIKAQVMGSCFGVERALNILAQQCLIITDKPLYTYGSLIHNKEVLKQISDFGIKEINETGDNIPGSIIIRAHGIDSKKYEAFKAAGFTIVDATCPIVKKNILKVLDETKPILYIGERKHSETISYRDSAKVPFFVIDEVEDLKLLDPSLNYALYVQTTYGNVKYRLIDAEIRRLNLAVDYKNTICKASIDRRLAVDELCTKVKSIVVIGDSMSSNSKALMKRIVGHGCQSYLVENLKDLKNFPYKEETEIGLTAAASVSSEFIDIIYNLLSLM